MFLFAICTISCQVLRWGIESRHLIWMPFILRCKDHGVLRAIPFGYQTYALFFILNLCPVSRDKTGSCDLTLKKSLELPQPTPHSTCSDIFHRRKKLKHWGVIHHFLTKVFESDTFCVGSVIDLFPISKCSIPELCFDFSGQKKRMIAERKYFL